MTLFAPKRSWCRARNLWCQVVHVLELILTFKVHTPKKTRSPFTQFTQGSPGS